MDFSLLERLVALPTPTGFELDGMRLLASSLKNDVSDLHLDRHGNLRMKVNPDCKQVMMLEAHCDEIGFIVQYIDENGLLSLSSLGGVSVPLVAGERIVLLGPKGPVNGVFAVRPIHLMSAKEREHCAPAKLDEIQVDIGATSREDAMKVVELGTPAVVNSGWRPLQNGQVSCRGFDNRAGAFVVAEATRRLAKEKLNVQLNTVFSVQEEVGLVGGITAAREINPSIGFCVDVTFATDVQRQDRKVKGDVALGKGPVVAVGPTYHSTLRRLVERSAADAGIPYQNQVRSRGTGTCAWAMRMANGGAAVAQIGVPLRYMHTPIEVISLDDVEKTVELLVAAIRSIPADLELCQRLEEI